MAIMVLLAIPVTIFVGMTYLQDQKYLFISLLVMIECMIPFFLGATAKDTKIATVTIKDRKIIIKGVKAGSTSVTVTDKDKKAGTISVTVK